MLQGTGTGLHSVGSAAMHGLSTATVDGGQCMARATNSAGRILRAIAGNRVLTPSTNPEYQETPPPVIPCAAGRNNVVNAGQVWPRSGSAVHVHTI